MYINNKLINENYLSDGFTYGNIDMVVPRGHVFTMGDNRENSDDSRKGYIGTISKDDIIGKVNLRLYPFDKIEILK